MSNSTSVSKIHNSTDGIATVEPGVSCIETYSVDMSGTEHCDPSPVDHDAEYLTGLKLYTIFIALIFVILMIALDAAILSTAIPRITNDFHTIANIGWYGSAYMIGNCCLQPLTGKAYAFFSLKRTFIIFIVLFELGSTLCAAANSSMMLIIGRAVAGMGGSGLAAGSMTLITIAVQPDQRPTMIGTVMSMFGVGQLIGPLVGGALTQHVSWRWCFWINLPIGAASVAGLLFIRLPKEDKKPTITRSNFFESFDLLGFILFAPASIMLLLAIQWGGIEYAWSSATIIGLLGGSAATYILFGFWERHQGDHAMFPASTLSQRIILYSLISSFLLGGASLVKGYYLPFWFQVIKHASPTTSAVYTLPTFISQILFAIIAGPLSARIGYFAPFSLAGNALSSIGAGLLTTLHPTSKASHWIGYQILGGAGRGMAMQQPICVVQAALPKSKVASGMALVMWAQFFGGAVSLGLAQTAFSSLLKAALATFAPDVDPLTVIHAGATNYPNVIPLQDQMGVLSAYNQAVTKTYYLPAAMSAIAVPVAMGMGWKRVIAKKQTVASEVEKGIPLTDEN